MSESGISLDGEFVFNRVPDSSITATMESYLKFRNRDELLQALSLKAFGHTAKFDEDKVDASDDLRKELRTAREECNHLKTLLTEALPYLESHQDSGPVPNGWQSPSLQALIENITNA